MTATKDVRGRLIWVALACFILESGCARYRDWVWKTSGARPSPTAVDPDREPNDGLNITKDADDAAAGEQGRPDTRSHR